MKIKDLIKRIYYALTVTGAMVIAMLLLAIWPMDLGSTVMEYLGVSFFTLLSLGVCWLMTRHNKPSHFKWYAGVIIADTLMYIYLPLFQRHFIWLNISPDAKVYTLFTVYCLCVAMATFLSNTKYNNVLPNQSKGVSTMFRVLSWTGQIAIWGYGIAVLVTVLWFSR